MSSWLSFWERPNRIYVNERHRAVHYEQVAQDLLAVLPGRPGAAVLDYGCGEALDAARIAARVGRLYLYDAARPLRERLAERFAGIANLGVLDDAGLASLAPASLDLIVVNSVIQYIPRAELPALLARWRGWLRPDGRLVLADVVPPQAGAVADVSALLGTAWRRGFIGAALLGLVATFASDYRRLRQEAGLSTYDEATIVALMGAAGLAARRRERNFGFNQARMTIIGWPLG